MVSRHTATISAYGFPTPSPSPPWDRGQVIQQQQQRQQQHYHNLLLQQQQQQQLHHTQGFIVPPTTGPAAVQDQIFAQQQQQQQQQQHLAAYYQQFQQPQQQLLQTAPASHSVFLPPTPPQAGIPAGPAQPGFSYLYHPYLSQHHHTAVSSIPQTTLYTYNAQLSRNTPSSSLTTTSTTTTTSVNSINLDLENTIDANNTSSPSVNTTTATTTVSVSTPISSSVESSQNTNNTQTVIPSTATASTTSNSPPAASVEPPPTTSSTAGVEHQHDLHDNQQSALSFPAMAQIVNHQHPQMMILPAAPAAGPGSKDSRWLTLEVCREYQRSKCSRSDNECKFAHPPGHVEVQNGRVVACFDSIKGKCQRKDPPCKYLHPPQHLREQLLQNGRNNLILKNMQLQAYQQYAGVVPVAGGKPVAVPTVMSAGPYSYLNPYAGLQALSAIPAQAPPAGYNPYITSPLTSVAMPTSVEATNPVVSQHLQHGLLSAAQPKVVRADKFETAADGSEQVASHNHLVDAYSFPQFYPQHAGAMAAAAAPPGGLPPQLVYAKKRARDPADDLLLQSTMPGMMPAYKRIAVGDIHKGGIPVYQTNPAMMSPLAAQHSSLMQLPQQPPYIPMSFAGHPPGMPRF